MQFDRYSIFATGRTTPEIYPGLQESLWGRKWIGHPCWMAEYLAVREKVRAV